MAALSATYAFEVELANSAEKLWEGYMNSTELLPKIFPGEFKSIELIEGDGKSVGSVRKFVFAEGDPYNITITERLELLDEASKTFAYSIIDGDVLKFYKVFIVTVQFSTNGDGCVAKWSAVYEKVSEETPPVEVFAEKNKETLVKIDEYLTKTSSKYSYF